MTDEGKLNNIDIVLGMFDTKTEVSENEIAVIHGNETRGLIQTMLTLGILFPLRNDERDRSFILGPAAYEIKVYGTYRAYREYLKNEKELSQQLIKSTLRTNWMQQYLLIATSVFGLLAFCVASADFIVHKGELEVAKEGLRLQKLQGKRHSSDSILCPCPMSTANQQFYPMVDSLKKK